MRRTQLIISVLILMVAVCPAVAGPSRPIDPEVRRVLIPAHRVPSINRKDKSLRYTGAFWSVGAFTGLTMNGKRRALGYVIGVEARVSAVMHLIGLSLSFANSSYRLAAAADSVRLYRNSFGAAVIVSPLFFAMLENNWLYYVASTFHVKFGASFELSTRRGTGISNTTERDIGWYWGLGLDVPLGSIHRGAAWWLTFAFRQNRVAVDTGLSAISELVENWFMLGISYRINGF